MSFWMLTTVRDLAILVGSECMESSKEAEEDRFYSSLGCADIAAWNPG
jgi:hypothetical protein